MRTATLVLLGIVAFGAARGVAAPVPKHLMKEAEGEKAKLQGKWKVESLQMGGKDLMAGQGLTFEMVIEFRGDTLTATANLGGGAQKTTATLNHYATAGVKRFTTSETTIVTLDGKAAPKKKKDELFGYAFDGDKLLLAAPNGTSKEAPDPLKPGPNDIVLVLVRMK